MADIQSADLSTSVDQFVLSMHPLSRNFKLRLQDRFDTLAVHYVAVTELRRLGIAGIFRMLRSIRCPLVHLVIEDETSQTGLPILQILASLTRCRKIIIIFPDLTRRSWSRTRLVHSAAAFATACVKGLLVTALCSRDIQFLARAPRMDVGMAKSRHSILYLKTNLALGVKAGGSIGHIAGVINAMCRRGLNVVYCAKETPVGVTPGALEHFHVPTFSTYGYPFEFNYYRYGRMFTATVMRSGPAPRWIYQRMSAANTSGVALSRQLRVPLVLEYNGSEAWVQKHWGRPLLLQGLAEQAESVCLRHAHLVVTVSEVLAQELVDRGLAPERIVWYPNCVDPDVYDARRWSASECRALRQSLGIAADATVVGFLGTFGRWHGTEFLAQAIRRLADGPPEWFSRAKVHFLLVGDGDKMSDVRACLNTDACRTVSVLTGLVPQDEGPLYLAASDILVSPHVRNDDGSRFFGSPTKLFEYMALERAILAADLEQIGTIIRPALHVDELSAPPSGSERGLLFEPGNLEQLIDGIQFLATRPALRAELGRNARQAVLKEYTWDRHVDLIFRRLEQLFPDAAQDASSVPVRR